MQWAQWRGSGDSENSKKASEMEKTTNLEEQIFLAALELAPELDRGEFLKQKCGDDQELLARVEELLGFHQQDDNLLDDTSGGFWKQNLADARSDEVGQQIGPYKLLQEIGVGGMGVVYMAEQSHPVRRKVAVKIIKLGMDTRNVIARFEAERQALALMDHPNITKVFDAGCTTTGRPYFVMELVTGLAITDYCDREKLSLRDRIELFYQVCVGIKHAHQKGIIHRDLKPSNVMVTHYDGVAVPKIIDFGIAKAVDQPLTDKTLFTSYGNMIGTPEYMSPEQAEMSGQDIDTRADVYSLGVLMYELLTGTTPFHHWKKKGIHKFCEAICNEEPELASTRVNNLADTVNEISQNRGTDVRTLKRILRGDMDWILSKCMSKNRNERYESAADLARDVKRYLDGQPIEAVGPNLSYRARKFVSKHRTSISFAAVILFTLIGATIVSTTFAIQATAAQKLANNRLQEVDKLRKKAVNERDRAWAAERTALAAERKALAAEQKLQLLERQSRIEAALARAAEKLHRVDGNVIVHYPVREQKHGTDIVLSGRGPVSERSVNVIAHEHVHRNHGGDVQILDIQATQNGVLSDSESGHNPHTFSIVIGKGGELAVTTEELKNANKILNQKQHDESHQYVIIQDKSGTKRFLKLFANEQRELFGPDDQGVANTLIEIGNLELEDEAWSDAEIYFRESRDILKLHENKEVHKAKVDLLLSKAQFHQQKHAVAKETFRTGVNRLIRLHQVPNELVEVVEDIKGVVIPMHEIHDWLPEKMQIELDEKLDHRVEIEIQK